MSRPLLTILLGIVTIWDTVTTVYGTYKIFGDGTIQLVVSIGFALLLAGFLIRTIPIIKNPSEELIPVGTKVLWFLAICYDIFTSFTGNMDLILGNATGVQKVVLAIGLTVFVCSAPIGLSKLIYDPDND
jgi:hypothetical protein